jgi:hypothetical protein
MNHQPFENWILEGSPLSNSQDKELHDHLLTCQKCTSLYSALTAVEREIRTLSVKSPRSGFTNRWKELAVERQAKALEEQSRRFLYGIAISAGVLLASFLLYTIFNGSPMSWLTGFMRTSVETIVGLKLLQHTITTWMRIVPLSIQLAIWIPIATIFGFLGLTWVIALWRIPTQGVQTS